MSEDSKQVDENRQKYMDDMFKLGRAMAIANGEGGSMVVYLPTGNWPQTSKMASGESNSTSDFQKIWVPTEEELEYIMANCPPGTALPVMEQKAMNPQLSLKELIKTVQEQ